MCVLSVCVCVNGMDMLCRLYNSQTLGIYMYMKKHVHSILAKYKEEKEPRATPPFPRQTTTHKPSTQIQYYTYTLPICSVGDSSSKKVTLRNISDRCIEVNYTLTPSHPHTFTQLTSSPLDPNGPFDLRNALRLLPPSVTHTLSLIFLPQQGGQVSLITVYMTIHYLCNTYTVEPM